MINEVPRRCRMDRMVPAELAILAAMEAVEAMPADVRLTAAVILLGDARNKVADFIDGVEPAAALAPHSDWQPIATAPKDQTSVMGYTPLD